jgi:hypothetical protein
MKQVLPYCEPYLNVWNKYPEGSCEHGDETSVSIKCWEVLEWLHNWQLLKKSSAL